MGLWPTQGDEKRLLFSSDCRWRRRPPLCHLDRSVPGFPTSRCWQRPRVRFSLRKPHDVDQRHESPQEIRGSVVERSLCGCSFLGMFFDRTFTKGSCSAAQTAGAHWRPRHRGQVCGTCWCGGFRLFCSGWKARRRFLCWFYRVRSAA
jgi:hypothetical protein